MEKVRVQQFKNRQKRLARRIEKETGLELKSISYVEYLPGAKRDWEKNKVAITEVSQVCIMGALIKPTKAKQRIHVIMEFNVINIHYSQRKTIDSILKRQYFIHGNKIEYSVNPHNKNSI